MTDSQCVAIIGASLAGLRAAEAIRRSGWDGSLVMVGNERHFPPADRPPLSKDFLADESETSDVALLRTAENLELEVRLGRQALGLDPDERTVALDGGAALRYDGLVIATGSTVRRLPDTEDRTNVHVLRTVDDAIELRAALRSARRVVIVGAGVLGCEIAATARQLGRDTVLIDSLPSPMVRVLGPAMAGVVADLQRGHGVELMLGRQVLGLRGRPAVDAVILDGQEVVPADLVVAAVGAVPETRWLETSGLALDDGVVCDGACFALGRTDVVAAGDVARWYHPLLAERVRVEHWTNAVSQGQLAGRNLVDALRGARDLTQYDALPYFWSDQYDRKIQFVGFLGDDVRVEEGDLGDTQFVAAYRRKGRLVGAAFMNWPSRMAKWRRLITEDLRSTD